MTGDNFWDQLMTDDDSAANYMQTYGEGPGCETRMIIGRYIPADSSVLDVGCGPGWNLDHLKQYGPKIKHYRGVDYSRRFVRVANKRAEDKKLNTIGFKAFSMGDARALKFRDESFDVVILQDVLEHLPGYKSAILEAARVAKETVIISFWKSWRTEGDGDQINDDGYDGYGSNYERGPFEEFIDNKVPDLLSWTTDETGPGANRHHYFYILTKGEK